jgi:hypothetical protein
VRQRSVTSIRLSISLIDPHWFNVTATTAQDIATRHFSLKDVIAVLALVKQQYIRHTVPVSWLLLVVWIK